MSESTEQVDLDNAQRFRQRSDDVRFALLLTYITLGWMTIEGAAALLLGWVSNSLLLEAFGIDSIIELFSGSVLLWRLKVEASSTATSEHVEGVERRAAKWVGYCSPRNRGQRFADDEMNARGLLLGLSSYECETIAPLQLDPAPAVQPKQSGELGELGSVLTFDTILTMGKARPRE